MNEEEVLAACSLAANKPGGEHCILTNKRIIINQTNESKSYLLSPHLSTQLVRKRSWSFLLAGLTLILAAFALIYKTEINNLLLLNLAFTGLICLYFSWKDKVHLKIIDQHTQIHIPVSNYSELRTFIKAVEIHKKHYYNNR